MRAARRGAWISFDGFRPERVADYVDMVVGMRSEGLLQRVLISQDAGWYHAGEPHGGEFSPFDPLFTAFVPALRQAGLAQAEVDTLLIDNPAAAFSIRVRS